MIINMVAVFRSNDIGKILYPSTIFFEWKEYALEKSIL